MWFPRVSLWFPTVSLCFCFPTPILNICLSVYVRVRACVRLERGGERERERERERESRRHYLIVSDCVAEYVATCVGASGASVAIYQHVWAPR